MGIVTKDGPQISTMEDISQRLTDPSSEAEALSNVASGIATSLGLAANQTNEQNSNEDVKSSSTRGSISEERPGPLADLENYNSQVSSTGSTNHQSVSESSVVNNTTTNSDTNNDSQSSSNNKADESSQGAKVS